MKNLLLVFSFFASLVTMGQPIVERASQANTVRDARLYAKLNLGLPRYADTTAANLQNGVDSCGTLISTYDNRLWKRECSPKKWVTLGAGAGTVTSVGLSMPSAFSVANSPITGSGTITVTGAGTTSQYVRGNGTLATFPTLLSSFTNDAGFVTNPYNSVFSAASLETTSGYLFLRSSGSDVGQLIYNGTGNWIWLMPSKSGTVAMTSDLTGFISSETDPLFDTKFATKTTDNLTEGTSNKYFTDSRARAAISAGTGIAYNSTTGVVSNTKYLSSLGYSGGTLTATLADGGTVTTTIAAGVTGTLTSGLIPRATGTSTLADGIIRDNGSTIGIGIAVSSSAMLKIKQSGIRQGIFLENNANDSYLRFDVDNTNSLTRMLASFTSTGSFLPLTFWTSDVERMRIFADGNISIGSTINSNKLDVTGSFRATGSVTVGTTISAGNTIQTSGGGIVAVVTFGGGAGIFGTTSNHPMELRSNNVSKFSIGTDGGLSTLNGGSTQSSGTTNFTQLSLTPTINNTGTYAGTSYGIRYNPTLTSLTGTTHVAVETVTGNVFFGTTSGRVGIGPTTTINSSALLQLTSTTKGFVTPVMTLAQRNSIASPTTGLELYCSNCTANDASTGVKQVYNGTTWKSLW